MSCFSCNCVRTCVSQKKKRYTDDYCDLDLTFISSRLIAMGYPSTGLEACYRNPYADVVKLLDRAFPIGSYTVFNLCAEPHHRVYAKGCDFGGRYVSFPMWDHHPCALSLLVAAVQEAVRNLCEHPARGVVVHCKAGKGRTGLVVCALLLAWEPAFFSGPDPAADVIAHYGKVRTMNGKGLTIPSQRRYVRYFYEVLRRGGDQPPEETLYLQSVQLSCQSSQKNIVIGEVHVVDNHQNFIDVTLPIQPSGDRNGFVSMDISASKISFSGDMCVSISTKEGLCVGKAHLHTSFLWMGTAESSTTAVTILRASDFDKYERTHGSDPLELQLRWERSVSPTRGVTLTALLPIVSYFTKTFRMPCLEIVRRASGS